MTLREIDAEINLMHPCDNIFHICMDFLLSLMQRTFLNFHKTIHAELSEKRRKLFMALGVNGKVGAEKRVHRLDDRKPLVTVQLTKYCGKTCAASSLGLGIMMDLPSSANLIK